MNLPFPVITPRLIDSKWFTADTPCDEETELAAMEHLYRSSLKSIGQQYTKVAPLGKVAPEPMEEEADSDEEGNDDSDETEESHDEDEEDVPTSYSPSRNNNDEPELAERSPEIIIPDPSLWGM